MEENERIPNSVLQKIRYYNGITDAATNSSELPQKKSVFDTNRQRYFRIPSVRPSVAGPDQNIGWWLAHFDGPYIARQMELHTEKPPLLLVAGKHSTKSKVGVPQGV